MWHNLKWRIVLFFVLIVFCGTMVQAQEMVKKTADNVNVADKVNDAAPTAASVAGEIPENVWPREIEAFEATIVIYQPQPESLEGNILKGRTAISLEFKNGDEPQFGALWFTATLDTDHRERLAIMRGFKVTDARIPFKDDKELERFRQLLEKEVPKWELPISLDRLLTSIETAVTQGEMVEQIKHDPPKIIFMSEPAILVTLDGEPRLASDKESSLMRVVNTPFTIFLVPEEKTYYLNADQKTWYKASDIKGDWQVADKVPAAVAKRAPKPDAADEEVKADYPDKDFKPGPVPKIVLATEPTELISATGKPEYTPIKDTGLLYLSNSDSDVFMLIESQEIYILLAGRWFSSKSLNGPWQYVPGEKLPADFAAIPEDSELATVLYAVPGTKAAREAVLEAQVPQTARVDRKKVDLVVKYDGNPRFETVTGTRMIYATNSATPVIYCKRKYYACDDAVWYISETATGPWRVADAIPEKIYTIPPDNPLYNVTHVRIYSVTPDEVYIGYTPGYTQTYVYGPTVVYGTGYRYPYWYGSVYYPYPVTYGFQVRYNSWGGWGFGFSYSNGPFNFYYGSGYYGGWWGPGYYCGYRRGYRHGHRHGHGHGGGHGNRPGYRSGHHRPRPDLYRSRGNRNRGVRPAVRPGRGGSGSRPSLRPGRGGGGSSGGAKPALRPNRGGGSGSGVKPANRRANNVFADRQGNIHRKVSNKWETRTRGGWSKNKRPANRPTNRPAANRPANRPANVRPSNRPSNRPANRPSNVRPSNRPSNRPANRPANRPSTGAVNRGGSTVRPSTRQVNRPATRSNNLNRSYQSRQRGTQRTNNFRSQRSSQPSRSMQRSRPSSGRSGGHRSGGGRRGGGGRRR